MATKLFLNQSSFAPKVNADTHLGTNLAKLDGTPSGWSAQALTTAAGGSAVNIGTNTVAGPTSGVEAASAGNPTHWISLPVSADVTISGAITGNIWAAETNMTDNVAINFVVDVIRATDNSIVEIVRSARTTEVALTTRAVNNFTATPAAGVVVNRGDRLRVRVFGDDAGTMNAGGSFSVGFGGGSAGVDGDTFVSFTETFSFESAPSGTQLFLTDTASAVATASVDREAWTARGGGVVNDVTNTAAGWTTPLQVTDTAGGTVVDWFTRQLTAFTLGGMAQANLRFNITTGLTGDSSAKCEIAVVDSDGTNPVVWGSWCIAGTDGNGYLTSTGEAAYTAWVSGDDVSVSDGQRLRIRVYLDDPSIGAMVTGKAVTFYYAGTSGGASGDSYVTLPQTVTEFTGTVARQPRPTAVDYADPAVFMGAPAAIRRAWHRRRSGIFVPEYAI